MRKCTDTTKREIVAQRHFGPLPGWLLAACHDALHDKPMSLERERRICAALGIEAPPNEYAVPECPGCGGAPHVAHDGCNGHPVAAVVVLAPGETVTKRKPRRYSRIDQMPTAMLARAIRERTNYADGLECA